MIVFKVVCYRFASVISIRRSEFMLKERAQFYQTFLQCGIQVKVKKMGLVELKTRSLDQI